MHGRAKPLVALVPENMINGRRQVLRLLVGGLSRLLVAKPVLGLGNIFQRRVNLYVVHKQRHMVSARDVIDTQTAISQLGQLRLGLLGAYLPLRRNATVGREAVKKLQPQGQHGIIGVGCPTGFPFGSRLLAVTVKPSILVLALQRPTDPRQPRLADVQSCILGGEQSFGGKIRFNIVAVSLQKQSAVSRTIMRGNKLAGGSLSCVAAGCAQCKQQTQQWAAHYSSTLPSTLAHRVPCTTQLGAIRMRGALTVVGEFGVPI